MDTPYHIPVLCKEAIESLELKKNGIYIDATFGGGGHTKAILEAEPSCKVIAVDWDTTALEINAERLIAQFGSRVEFVWGNFARIDNLLKKHINGSVDGMIADFGTSFYQLTQSKGFSFFNNTYLDMRMSPSHQKITAAEVLNSATQQSLSDIFFSYGQEPYAKKYAQAIVEQRALKPFVMTHDLAHLIEKVAPQRQKGYHPATQVFQALRLYVNKELENIRSFLHAAPRIIKKEGILSCITFHSLEDGLVKDYFKQQACLLKMSLISPKGIVPTLQEIERNPASRSARLRIAKIL